MIVLSSLNGNVGLPAAMKVLKAGGSALDAVEAGTRIVERNTADHSVGLGGLPNVLGDVRLDALIMDGRTLRAGAVGSVRGFVHVISLARRVMEETPHVFLVGEGAERFAREMGMAGEELLTPEAEARWREAVVRFHPELDPARVTAEMPLREIVRTVDVRRPHPAPPQGSPEDGAQSPESRPRPGQPAQHSVLNAPDFPAGDVHGTVNFIAQDRGGNLATAVSTSGWPWCYPGRVGDSPVIGAGGYADNRWGAAASTGTGEVVLRTSTTRSIVLYLKMGMPLAQATGEAMKDLRDLQDLYTKHIAVIALAPSGEHVGYTHRPQARYAYMTDTTSEPVEVEMVRV